MTTAAAVTTTTVTTTATVTTDGVASSGRLLAAARLDIDSSQLAFRVLLDALARPGLEVRPRQRLLAPGVPPALLVALALADLDVRVAVTGGADTERWARVIAGATGGRPSTLEGADIVVALDGLEPSQVRSVRRGRAEAPEEGARIAIACRGLSAGGRGALLELSGPGVAGSRRVGVDGVDRRFFAALAEVNATFPVGVDTWLLADDGGVVGLPRSTRIRIVDEPAGAGMGEG